MKRFSALLVLALALPGTAASLTVSPESLTPPATVNQAPIALLVDLSSRQTLFARQADVRMIPASMTKAMSALVAFDLIRAGRLNEDTVIAVRPQTAARWAGKGTTLSLRPNERIAVGDLLLGLTTVSANDAAVALAEGALGSEAAWLAAMNARAKRLGMNGSYFASANGFPDGGKTYVTAQDMVRLAEALIVDHPQFYRRYFGHREMEWRGQRLTSHDPFAGSLYGADGIKTGFTREAGFTFLGAVERKGRRLVLVVGKVPSEAGRAEAARALVEWGFGDWDSKPFLAPDWIVGAARVQDGAAREVPLAVPRAYSLAVSRAYSPVTKSFERKTTARIVYQGPLRAPFAKGTVVATLEVTVQDQGTHTLPLVAAENVAKAGPIDRIANGLLGLLK